MGRGSRKYSGGIRAAGKIVAKRLRRDDLARRFVILLLAADLFFVLLHLSESQFIRPLTGSADRIYFLRLDAEWSLAEIWGYLQSAGTVLLLVLLYQRTRQPIFLGWSAVFAFIVLDDSVAIHEIAGFHISQIPAVQTLFGMDAQSAGEILAWVIVAVLLLPTVSWGFLKSDPIYAGFGVILAGIFSLLVFFGVVVDMIHSLTEDIWPSAAGLLAILEDGGELAALSLAIGVVILWYRAPPPETEIETN